MKNFISILICLFVVCATSNNSYGQFWKKKNKGATSTSAPNGDSFSGKTKKGPNVYSSKPPRTKSRSKLYSHSISEKKLQKKNKSVFSSTKRRYKSVNASPKEGGDKGAKSSVGGRKSGKGRKKEK
ncbi:MAG: hypothetical protein COX70_00030 [Flavobacteriales bacterium CG_4_10_14_0_2_um_filter_32_8]|nr:MAG: hypothetical protein COX70_00030 [Flavobacteriales bacterium CG_4_10_14_0_2_um_filter_32_8]PJB14521.1 MAG: hypothetical protein CO118_08190 [Flavobacteriales bacterium CG_4_9_14_3_um_filter_32_8]